VWRILKRLDMSRLPSSQRYKRHQDRWKRYEKPLPGHRVQIDVKFIAPSQGETFLPRLSSSQAACTGQEGAPTTRQEQTDGDP
jgi:hypothetical protein